MRMGVRRGGGGGGAAERGGGGDEKTEFYKLSGTFLRRKPDGSLLCCSCKFYCRFRHPSHIFISFYFLCMKSQTKHVLMCVFWSC